MPFLTHGLCGKLGAEASSLAPAAMLPANELHRAAASCVLPTSWAVHVTPATGLSEQAHIQHTAGGPGIYMDCFKSCLLELLPILFSDTFSFLC